MGNTSGTHRIETLVVAAPVDIERALLSTTLPKRVDLTANLLTHAKGAGVERLLKRVGCHELCIQGKSANAPRRVFQHEIVAAIGHVKQRSMQKLILKNLDIHDLQGHQQPHDSLRYRLLKLNHLEELHIQSCFLSEDAVEDVLLAIKELPLLKQVTINLRNAVGNRSLKGKLVHTFSGLVARTAVTSVAMSEFPLDSSFWKTIAASTSLTHLGLALRDDQDNAMMHPRQRQFFWDLLQSNASIRQLELQVSPGVSLKPLINLLVENTTLTSLLLHLKEDPTAVTQWITNVLENDNFTLQSVHILCHNLYGYKVRIPNRQIDFFTRLNRNGRRHLVRDDISTRNQEWIDALAQNTYDLASTYYWLQANPNLITRASSS